MAIIFNTMITFNAGEILHFRSISCIADHEGILHRISDPSGKKSSLVAPKAQEVCLNGTSENFTDKPQSARTSVCFRSALDRAKVRQA
jgi:hypothetical protein